MPPRIIRTILLVIACVAVIVPSFFCNSPKAIATDEEVHTSAWKNVYDTSAHYVGMNTCKGCHMEVYNTFIQTGMGQSFGVADKQKSAADFSPAHALVYDSALDFYYKPSWDGDTLIITEFRLEGRDTVHKRVQKVNYIVGSGQHTNSHLFNTNGFMYQAPITFYTQKHRWDLAPGFEKGANSRFGRMIQIECMSCHNGYPNFVANSENKYNNVMTGIDCERCHGPGSLHVADKQAGKMVDTSKTPDYTIVNPRRLSTELQNNVCQRCHLQGISVLNDGKNFYDFRPGMKLSEVMNVFMPQYEGGQDKMIMASHVERMKMSRCFVESGKMSCITCHNPHVSVKFTPRAQYITACQGCHNNSAGRHQCSEPAEARAAKGNDCISCHMPHNGSIDIPHVAVTDHYIRRRPISDAEHSQIKAFLGMKCINSDKVDHITTARAFLEFYERYTPSADLLDSSLKYLDKQKEQETTKKQSKDYIRTWYLQKDLNKIMEAAKKLKPADINDAWTAYRIGFAYDEQDHAADALPWWKRAVEIWPFSLDFENKYGICLIENNRADEAKKVFEWVLTQNPNNISANTNLGNLYLMMGNPTMAYDYMTTAQTLDPDYEQNLINLAVWYHANQRDDAAKKTLEHLVKHHPTNDKAKAMLQDLGHR